MAVTQSSLDELIRWQRVEADTIAALPRERVEAEMGTQASGLSSEEAAVRLQVSGYSSLVMRSGWRSVAQQLAVVIRPLLLPLWIGALIAFSIDRVQSGQALLFAALLNTLVGALQERKAERATAALHDALPAFARVLRDGQEQNVLATMLVPGDVLLLRPGDILPADARLVEVDHLHTVNPVLYTDDTVLHKTPEAVAEDKSTSELPNVVYAGSRVVSGSGRAVVFATGLRSAFGQIAALTQRAQEEPSPLLLAFARLGAVVLIVAVLGAILGFTYSLLRLQLSIEQALSVAVLFLTAAVPVGLMPGITLTLIEGARRLQQRKAIFRRLSNVETLGATTVICTDKTGTLTQNEMTVREIWTADGSVTVSGVGFQPQGEFSSDHRTLDHGVAQKQFGQLLRAAVLTSRAKLLPPDTLRPRWHIVGDPVEAAQIVAAAKVDLKVNEVCERAPLLATLNSTPQVALDGVVVEEHGYPVAYLKGRPSDLLARCSAIATAHGDRPLTERDRQAFKRVLQRYQRDVMRTVAVARRTVGQDAVQALDVEDVAHDLVLLGLLAINDPPREEVAAAISACHTAKIRTMMLTSDDTLGATSLARRCQLVQAAQPLVISGPDLDTMDDPMLREQLSKGDMVLARLTPEHKVRVVQTLEAMGEVVLVTGGAASDVPALKAAYTGIAMGATGSPAANQAADLILLDDNFATIAQAIAEGRAVEQRVRRLVALNLATTVVKLVALTTSLLAGAPLLLTVGQQLLIDFLGGLLPGLAIGAGRPDPRLMQRPPRPTGRPLLSRKVYLLGYGLFGGLAAALALLAALGYVAQARGTSGAITPAEIFATNLRPYSERIADVVGQRGLVATSLYVVVSIAALLGAALIRRSAAADDRGPRYLLLGLVGLSYALLIGIIELDVFHRYIALTSIPAWGWAAAFGATALAAGLEMLRQRLDPIFPSRSVPDARSSQPPLRMDNKRSGR